MLVVLQNFNSACCDARQILSEADRRLDSPRLCDALVGIAKGQLDPINTVPISGNS
jgi:hypothetical protein